MKYYKLVKDNNIIGAVSSINFVRYSPISNCFLNTDEDQGEYISYKGKLYRSTWMRPIVQTKEYISVLVLEITEEEYNTFNQAIEQNEFIVHYDEPEPQPEYVDPVEVASIEFIRQSKINEMSLFCRQTIEAGFDLELRGETHHFSLDTQDQLNLISLGNMAQTQDLIPYHADGEVCIFYTAAEINAIVAAATAHKVYHTTYYNALKTYINALDTIEAISAITYGVSIPQEYKSEVLIALENEAST